MEKTPTTSMKVLFIGSDDCRPCRDAKALLDDLRRSRRLVAEIETLSITAENLHAMMQRYKFTALPTVILFRDNVQLLRYPEDCPEVRIIDMLDSGGFLSTTVEYK